MSPQWPKQPVLELDSLRRRPGALPSLLDLPYRIYTRSGRSAIVVALQLIGVRPGERVLVPSYHCPTMIAPVAQVGAVPVFYPIDWDGMPRMPPARESIGIRAMLLPHLFGIPRQFESVAAYCRQRQIAIIEDCAHTFFGQAGGIPVGTTGDYAIGSLPKFFPVLQGGLLASSRHCIPTVFPPSLDARANLRAVWDMVDLSARANRLGPIGHFARSITRWRRGRQARPYLNRSSIEDTLGGEVRRQAMTDTLLPPGPIRWSESWLVEHCDLDANIRQRQDNYSIYSRSFKGLAGTVLPDSTETCGAAPYVFPLVIDDPEGPYQDMRASNLPVFRWDRLWPGTPITEGDAGTRWSRHLIQFACHQSLGPAEILRIAKIARQCIAKK